MTNWWWWRDESLISSLPVAEREGGAEKLDGGGRDKTWSSWTGGAVKQKSAKTYTYDHTNFDHNKPTLPLKASLDWWCC